VCLQLGAPIGIAISNIIANGRNSPTAVGAELLPGYRAAFYSFTVMAGAGLVVSLLIFPNSDPVRLSKDATDAEAGEAAAGVEVDTVGGDKEELGETESDISEIKGATIFEGSSTSLEKRA
jgi:hypothetical protein